jgi:hypothetical protein
MMGAMLLFVEDPSSSSMIVSSTMTGIYLLSFTCAALENRSF